MVVEGGGATSAERDHMGIDASEPCVSMDLPSLEPRVLLLVQASHWQELNGLSVFSVGFSKNV